MRSIRRNGALLAVGSLILASGTAVVAGTAVAVSATAANASLPLSGRVDVKDPEVRWVSTKFHLSDAEARRRLERQDLMPAMEKVARDRLGADFAGIWSDIQSDKIYIGTAGNTADLTAVSVDPRLEGHVEQRQVAHSLKDLESLSAEIIRATSATPHYTFGGVDLPTNRLIVRRQVSAARTTTDTPEAAPESVLAIIRSHSDEVSFEDVGASFKPTKKACVPAGGPNSGGYFGEAFCDPPLRGGVTIGSSRVTCSAGLIGRSTSNSLLYVITAGHCLKSDLSGVWNTRYENFSLHAIGIPHAAFDNSTQDFGDISISSPATWNPKALVLVAENNIEPVATTAYDEFYDVPAPGVNQAGAVVCSTLAFSSYTTCGVIGRVGVAAMGMTNLAEVRGSNYCGVAGDSGAPVFKSHLARGIFVGSTSDTGGCVTWYYQDIANVLSTLHLTLAVSG